MFGVKYDETLRNGCRAAKAPVDLLGMDTGLAEAVKEIKDKLKQELPVPAAAIQTERNESATAEGGEPEHSAAFASFLEGVKARCGDVGAETVEKMREFEAKARALVSSNISLHVYPGTEKELLKILQNDKVASIRGGDRPDSWVGIFVDPCQWGEAITNPNVRTCPLNQNYLKTFLNAVVASRDSQSLTLHSKDMYFFFDSFQPHLHSKLLGALQTPTGQGLSKNTYSVTVSYDEESLRTRRTYVKRESTTFNQLEQMLLVTQEPFQEAMKYRSRSHFKGTNMGNKIGDVSVDPPGSLWSLTMKARCACVCVCSVCVSLVSCTCAFV